VVLPAGTAAPAFEAPDAEGKTWGLDALRGRPFVLTFYPKDETAGCVKQTCAFRDVWSDFRDADVEVFGVSRDDAESHSSFATNRRLPYRLLTDASGQMHKAYDVGRTFGATNRVSYLVDAQGRIAEAYKGNLSPEAHAERMLTAARALARRA
jgi:peroxiredoxin Q/BCP